MYGWTNNKLDFNLHFYSALSRCRFATAALPVSLLLRRLRLLPVGSKPTLGGQSFEAFCISTLRSSQACNKPNVCLLLFVCISLSVSVSVSVCVSVCLYLYLNLYLYLCSWCALFVVALVNTNICSASASAAQHKRARLTLASTSTSTLPLPLLHLCRIFAHLRVLVQFWQN